jgi:hypothetical protein
MNQKPEIIVITTDRGVLWDNGRMLDVQEADWLANEFGLMYAEHLVDLLEGKS